MVEHADMVPCFHWNIIAPFGREGFQCLPVCQQVYTVLCFGDHAVAFIDREAADDHACSDDHKSEQLNVLKCRFYIVEMSEH
ncbi:hypothetical protein D3C86_1330040 [compost metagenome]